MEFLILEDRKVTTKGVDHEFEIEGRLQLRKRRQFRPNDRKPLQVPRDHSTTKGGDIACTILLEVGTGIG